MIVAGDLPKLLGGLATGSANAQVLAAGAVAKLQGNTRKAAMDFGSWLQNNLGISASALNAAAGGAGAADAAATEKTLGLSFAKVKSNATLVVAGFVAIAAYFAFRRRGR